MKHTKCLASHTCTCTVVYQISVMFGTTSTMNVVGVSVQYFARRTQTIQNVTIFKLITIPRPHIHIHLNISFSVHCSAYLKKCMEKYEAYRTNAVSITGQCTDFGQWRS